MIPAGTRTPTAAPNTRGPPPGSRASRPSVPRLARALRTEAPILGCCRRCPSGTAGQSRSRPARPGSTAPVRPSASPRPARTRASSPATAAGERLVVGRVQDRQRLPGDRRPAGPGRLNCLRHQPPAPPTPASARGRSRARRRGCRCQGCPAADRRSRSRTVRGLRFGR